MAFVFPSAIDTPPGTVAQGTSLVTSPDHGLDHRTLGSAVIGIETFLGTNSGTNVFGAYTAGQLPLAEKGGTLQKGILGTINLTGNGTNFGTMSNGAYKNPSILISSDAQGDIYYRNSGGSLSRLGIGTNGQILTTNGTLPSWGAVGGTQTTNVRARAYLGTAMGTVANNTEVRVALDTIDYDSGTNFTLGTAHRFTAPVAGYYMITGVTSFPDGQGSNGGRWATEIRKNGTNMQFSIAHLSNTSGISAQAAGIFQLAANDFIELYAYNLTGTNTGVAAGSIYNSLAIHLLSI